MSQQIPHCEQCQQRYNLFRRKKECYLCGQIFCSKCVPKCSLISLNNRRVCLICLLIKNEETTEDQLLNIRVKHLRAYLIHSKLIPINRLRSCFEKQDLIHLIQSTKRTTFRQAFAFTHSSHTNNNNTDNTDHPDIQQSTTDQDQQISTTLLPDHSSTASNETTRESPVDSSPSKVPNKRTGLNEISSLESIDDLTVRQLKDILIQNFVSMKGCVEKTDLITKVQLLYRDQQQQQKEKESNRNNIPNEESNDNLCKICMDENIDCVLLDCGHLCTCIQCGKRLSECPLCRSYIIRVVRVFKS